MGALQWLALAVVCCATVHAIGINSKVDLPSDESEGEHHAAVDAITPDLVQAVLNVNVKGQKPPSTRVNAVICVNGAAPCPSVKTPIADEDEDEGEDGHVNVYGKTDKEEVEEEEEDGSHKVKSGVVYVDDEPEGFYFKKKKKKKIPDVPVIIGYKGANDDTTRNTYEYQHSYDEIPVHTGFKLGPEFDKPHHIYSYLQPPAKDVVVTFKHLPIDFDATSLVGHIFDTSPFIKALTSTYSPVIQHHGGPSPRIDLETLYHHQDSIPGFYGGIQPRTFIGLNRGLIRPGCRYPQGVYPPRRIIPWPTTPPTTGVVKDKLNFEDEEEDTAIDIGGTPVVINVDGKLGDALEGRKT